jgi:hypothetical protein
MYCNDARVNHDPVWPGALQALLLQPSGRLVPRGDRSYAREVGVISELRSRRLGRRP